MSVAATYRITPSDPAAHLFEVELTVHAPHPEGQLVRLPAWIPGSYMIREMAKHVVALRASRAGAAVAATKVDKDTWRLAPGDGPVVVHATVYAWDLSVRLAHLDHTHGFFNGTSLCLAVVGQEDAPCEVELVPPTDPRCTGWRVATTLPRTSGEPWGFGRFRAASYDELVDHPVELGTFEVVSFTARGVPHHLALTGRQQCDLARLAADLEAICSHHLAFFGDPPPIERYLFLLTVVGSGYGGLEHRSSTALIASRDQLPVPGREEPPEVSEGYRGLLGLCSHEYFHTWNVKRIKPRAFVPYDLAREAHTTLLWAFEGITSYYDDLGLLRSGRIDTAGWLELLGQTFTRVLRGSGRHKQSVAESSFDAWTKFYRQDENAPNAVVSYYAKGALIALALDLHLRDATDDRVSLDTLMRALWARHGDGSGVPEDGVEALAAELSGLDLQPWFDQAVRGTDDPPYAALLASRGVTLHLRAATGTDDKGGKPAPARQRVGGELGATLTTHALGARLKHVDDQGAAHDAGLSADDVIVAVDGLKVGVKELAELTRQHDPGTRLRVHAFRRDELLECELVLGEPALTTAYLTLQEDAAPEVAARRARWLEGRPA